MENRNKIYLFTGLLILGFLFMSFGNLNQQKYIMISDNVIKRISDGALYQKGLVFIKFKTDRTITGEMKFGIENLDKTLKKNSVTNVVQPHPLKQNILMRKIGDEDIARIYLVKYDSEIDPSELSEEILKNNKDILDWAEPSFVYTPAFVPNDPSIGLQWFLSKINAYQGWDLSQGDTNVVIGIVDSGSDLDHPDLAANIKYNYLENPTNGIDDDNNGLIDDWRGWDFAGADINNLSQDNDPNIYNTVPIYAHGSHVSGSASEVTNNAVGGAGVGFKTKLLISKHSADNDTDPLGKIYFGNLGIAYCYQNNADIINCSYGGSSYSQYMQAIINAAWANGTIVVAAAGNTGTNAAFYPASYDNVISVAATDTNDLKTDFSTYHSTVDICAPGVNIYGAHYNDTFTYWAGTSFASPIVSGTLALIKAKFPAYTPQQLVNKLLAGVDSIYHLNPQYTGLLGSGRVNVFKCLQDPMLLITSNEEIPANYLLEQNYPNPFNSMTNVKFKIAMDSRIHGNDNVVLKVFDMLGREVATLVNESLKPGTYEITFDARDLPSGIYFYKLSTNSFSTTKKLILLK